MKEEKEENEQKIFLTLGKKPKIYNKKANETTAFDIQPNRENTVHMSLTKIVILLFQETEKIIIELKP